MKKMQTLALALALVALGSVSWATTSLNSSRGMQKKPPETASTNFNSSRSDVYAFVYDKSRISSDQAQACLKDFDQSGKGKKIEDAEIKRILRKHNVEKIEYVRYVAPDQTHKLPRIFALISKSDEPVAIHIAVGDSVSTHVTIPTRPPND